MNKKYIIAILAPLGTIDKLSHGIFMVYLEFVGHKFGIYVSYLSRIGLLSWIQICDLT